MGNKSVTNKNGEFLVKYGKKAVFAVKGNTDPTPSPEKLDYTVTYEDYNIAPWFDCSNNHPSTIWEDYIQKYTVLAASIKYKTQLLCGQGIFPAIVEDIGDNGKEILRLITDEEIRNFLNSRNIKSYLYKAAYNLVAYGNLFPELIFNASKNKIFAIYEKDARMCRWQVANENGVINNLFVHPKWSELYNINAKIIPVLDYDDPLTDLQKRISKSDRFAFLN